MFVVKKLLGHLLMPLPFALTLLSLGLLLRLRGHRWLGRGLAVTGWLLLVVAGNRGGSIALTSSLENTYPPVPLARSASSAPANTLPAPSAEDAPGPATTAPETWPADLRDAGFVAVLGGGHGDAAALSAGQRLSPSARARLVEGLRIAFVLPDAWLVLSGPGNDEEGATDAHRAPTHARVLADAAVELGFPRARIIEIDTARDTAEEVAALRRLAGEERVALVTSAWHLPRAMQLARAEGLSAFPCPSDYLGGRDARIDPLAWATWDAESLSNTTRAWREYLGRAWARMVAWWRD